MSPSARLRDVIDIFQSQNGSRRQVGLLPQNGSGLARNMRYALSNSSFIGFTGTPIVQNEANTRAVFGEYVSICDIQQAVIGKATVPIDYEGRIAKLSLIEAERPKVDSLGAVHLLRPSLRYLARSELRALARLTVWATPRAPRDV